MPILRKIINMRRILYMVVLAGLFSACNNSKSNTATETQAATQSGLSGSQAAPTATTAGQAGLLTNPEHGKPGHDCALPVGAPLAQKTNTQQLPPPQPAAPTVTAPATAQPVAEKASGSGKLNPAHGQPGHDCAKPVGAPLS